MRYLAEFFLKTMCYTIFTFLTKFEKHISLYVMRSYDVKIVKIVLHVDSFDNFAQISLTAIFFFFELQKCLVRNRTPFSKEVKNYQNGIVSAYNGRGRKIIRSAVIF